MKTITTEQYDELLWEIISNMGQAELAHLLMTEAYEKMSELLNNEVLAAWEDSAENQEDEEENDRCTTG